MYTLPFIKYLEDNKYSSFNLKAVLFDMDGVLFDSMKWHAKSWKKTMDDFNLHSDENEFYLHEGMVGHNTIRHIIMREQQREPSQEEVNEIYLQKTNLFAKLNDKSVIEFAPEFVYLIREYNLLCTLVTGSGQFSLLEHVKEKYGDAFDKSRMVTAYDVKKGKPDPEPYLMGLKKSGEIKPNEAIVIENAPRGVESAKAAGIFCIAINTGPLDSQVLKEAGADIVLESMKDLYDKFEDFFKIFKTLKISTL